MNTPDLIEAAQKQLDGRIVKTPLTYDPDLDVYFKWENHQHTHAFKFRGALNKILALELWERERGLVAASAGNHGLGVAYAARLIGAKATVFLPENAMPIKEQAMLENGAVLHKVNGDYAAAEKEAQAYAIRKGATWVSPYNDWQIIAGFSTIGLELVEQIDPFEARACIVPVSGGGLVSGIGLAFRFSQKHVKLFGVQSANSTYFHSLYHVGSQKDVHESTSIADGLTGAIEKNSITIPLVRSMLDDFILVTEEEIEQAIAYCYHKFNEVIEGSAAVPLAAILCGKIHVPKSILIITGGNIQLDLHAKICKKWQN